MLATYHFCPNCGTTLDVAPLSTTLITQVWIYAFSIILPLICFIMVTRWPGITYFRSSDPKAKSIGLTAIVLLTLSTIITIWLAYISVQTAINYSLSSLNVDTSALGM